MGSVETHFSPPGSWLMCPVYLPYFFFNGFVPLDLKKKLSKAAEGEGFIVHHPHPLWISRRVPVDYFLFY